MWQVMMQRWKSRLGRLSALGLVIGLFAFAGIEARAAAIVQVAAGDSHTVILLADGTVQAWGSNVYGQCGNGTTSDMSPLVTVTGLDHVVAVAAGLDHNVALLADGTVKAWGKNAHGQLGSAVIADHSSVPVTVAGLSQVLAVAAGDHHNVALLADGTLKTWGDNTDGQLGNGLTGVNNQDSPVSVAGLGSVVAIAAGQGHSLALLADGTLRTWGRNEDGQLGNGTFVGSPTPVAVTGLGRPVTAVAAKNRHNLALLDNGTIMAWGNDWQGQLGVGGSYTSSSTPRPVAGLTSVKAIAAGGSDIIGAHSLALLADGTVRAWGSNAFGQLGNNGSSSNTPVTATGFGGTVVAIDAGADHSVALLADGTLKAWGYNQRRRLGVDLSGGADYSVTPLTVMAGQGGSRVAPTLTKSVNGLNVRVTWNAVPGATGYTLLYAAYPWMPWMTMADIHGINLWSQQGISVDLWPGAAFYIALQARNPYGDSDYSNIDWFVLGQ